MLNWIREKFGPTMIALIIGLIASVFVFYGIFNPSRTRGLHEGAVAGTVNGEVITLAEFNRAYNQRLEYYRMIGGAKITDAMIKSLKLRESTFNDLVTLKLTSQAAEKAGLQASDEELRERILTYPAFQKNGKFDAATYKMVLQANQYTPGNFEKLIRDEITERVWQRWFRERVRTSEQEARREFMTSNDKRNIKYVLLTNESGKKAVTVSEADIAKYLKDPAKLSMVKSQFELKKSQDFKGKTLEQVQSQIARDLIAAGMTDEIKKANEAIADKVVAAISGSGSDGAVNALLKPYGVEVKKTGLITRGTPYLPGVGEAKELMADAFSPSSPIASKAKKYTSGGWLLVAVISETQKPDQSKFEGERRSLLKQITLRKERALYEAWLKGIRERSKPESNPAVVGSEAGDA